MKITGQTSIRRLKTYIDLQKQLGNSLIGDYTLFLKQEVQTNKIGKTFNNYILDIIKKEDFISNNTIPESQANQKQLSTNTAQTFNNSIEEPKNNVVIKQVNKEEQKEIENPVKEVKKVEKKATKKATKETKKEELKQGKVEPVEENTESKNEFENHYVLVETSTKTLMKAGKPTEYVIGNFVDMNDKTIDVVIPPKFADELLQCDIGTTVILDLATIGDKTFTNNIEYVQKCLKNVAA